MISKEDFINFYNKFKNSIILLYSKIRDAIKRFHVFKNTKNKKQIKSISNKKNRSDDNLDVVAVKIKKVTVKKKMIK
jgi:hypothetical protein